MVVSSIARLVICSVLVLSWYSTAESRIEKEIYISQSSWIVAVVPEYWEPDRTLVFDYVNATGTEFITSSYMPFHGDISGIDALCSMLSAEGQLDSPIEISWVDWSGKRACILRSDFDRSGTLVAQYPLGHSRAGTGAFLVKTNLSNFDDVLSSVSADQDLVTNREFVESFLDLLFTRFVSRSQIDWELLYAKSLDMLKDPESTDLLLANPVLEWIMVQIRAGGGDEHNWIMQLGGGTITSSRQYVSPSGEILEGQIGYLQLPYGPVDSADVYSRFLDDTIRDFQQASVCGWIIDLRSNSGGNVYAMIAGVYRFLPDGELIRFVYPNGAIDRVLAFGPMGAYYVPGSKLSFQGAVQTIPYTPSEGHISQPLVVLVGPETYSSGEALTIILRNRPNTLVLGQQTAGLTTGTSYFTLMNGSTLSLSTTWMASPDGRVFPEGVEPDATVVQEAPDQDIDAATMDSASKWITRTNSDCETEP